MENRRHVSCFLGQSGSVLPFLITPLEPEPQKPITVVCTYHLGNGQEIYSLAQNQSLNLNLSLSQLTRGCTGRQRLFLEQRPLHFSEKVSQKSKYFHSKLCSISREIFYRKTFPQNMLPICINLADVYVCMRAFTEYICLFFA